MSDQLRPLSHAFEQKLQSNDFHVSSRIEKDALVLADTAIRFSFVERVPRYTPETRENDAEHSFMLGLVAQELAAQYFPELDCGLVARFSLVHDLLELKTGDVATFSISDDALAEKMAREHAAKEELCATLPAHTSLLVTVYEEQDVPEARFVRFIDKLLPVLVDILGPGSQVMHEDYATFTHNDLEAAEISLSKRFESMFPDEFLKPIHLARNALARRFSDVFVPLIQPQDALF